MLEHGKIRPSARLSRARSTILRLDRAIATGEEWLGMFLLAMLFILLVAQVLFRFLVATSIFWIEEVARLGLIWIVLIGVGFGVARSAHIVVTNLTERLPDRWTRSMEQAGLVLMLVVGVVLAVASGELMQALSGVKASSSGLSRSFYFLPGAIGFALVAFHSAVRLIMGSSPAHRQSQIKEPAV